MSSAVRWGFAALAALTALAPQASKAVAHHAAWVVGANDGSVARIDIDAGSVEANLATVGFLANRIEADPSGSWAVVVCSGSDDLYLLDLATAAVTATIPLPAGTNPWDAEILGDRIFVTALLRDRVHVVDVSTRTLVTEIPVGKAPEGMCVAGGVLWVANTGFDFTTFEWQPGSVTAIDPVTYAVLATLPVHLNPQECVRSADDRVHVVCTGNFGAIEGQVDVIDPVAANLVASLSVSGYPGTATVASGSPTAYLGVTTTSFGTEVLAYDTQSFAWIHGVDDPLLPSFDFYGNLRTTADGRLLTTNFPADFLLVETPSAPGSPSTFLVGDGPIDLAVVKREAPITAASNPSRVAGTRLAIRAVAPNPSRGDARISWYSPNAGSGRLEIFDVAGRRVLERELGNIPQGEGVVRWDGRSNDGAAVTPGLFLVRLSVGDASATERLLRLR